MGIMINATLLEASGLTKRFPGVLALESVQLSVAHGETVAVIGENGAGKSTLMKILSGIYTPDAGTISYNGSPVSLTSVNAAQALGISLIHQELNLADNLDVAGNVFLGREPRKFGLLDKPKMRQQTQRLLDRLGATFKADTPVEDLSLGQQQLVEIAKALSLEAKLLIMDEPTSSLSARESDVLFKIIEDLKAQGMSILYISHRLGEVKRLADRLVALRDGRNAGELSRSEISHDAMVRLMVGRDMSQVFASHATRSGRRSPCAWKICARAPIPPIASASRCVAARSSAWPASSAQAAPNCCGPCLASSNRWRVMYS